MRDLPGNHVQVMQSTLFWATGSGRGSSGQPTTDYAKVSSREKVGTRVAAAPSIHAQPAATHYLTQGASFSFSLEGEGWDEGGRRR